MNRKQLNWAIGIAVVLGLMVLLWMRAGGAGHSHGEEGHGQGEEAHAEVERGPHGGRLLESRDVTIEVTIYETGIDPEFRLYAYDGDKPISPQAVQATLTVRRLGTPPEPVTFKPEADYLRGQRHIYEPHSFAVDVRASYRGKTTKWTYSQEEGRVEVPQASLASAGITLETAGPQALTPTLEVAAQIVAAPNGASDISAQVPGVVLSVRKQAGETVAKGEVLAEIGSSDLSELAGRLAAAKARLAEAEHIAAREEALWKKQRTAEMDVQAARRGLTEARSEVAALQGQMATMGIATDSEAGQSRFALRAPRAGVITQQNLQVGKSVQLGELLMSVADPNHLGAELTLYAADLAQVRIGQRVVLTAEDSGSRAEGTVAQIGAQAIGGQAFIARVVLTKTEGVWRSGMFGKARIQLAPRKVPVAVRAEAIQTFRDWQVVFARYDDAFEVRPLTLGLSDGEWVEVVEGLPAGTVYAARNSFVLKAELGKAGASHDH